MMQSTQFRCLNRIKNDPINTRNASSVIPKDLGGVMYEIIYDYSIGPYVHMDDRFDLSAAPLSGSERLGRTAREKKKRNLRHRM